MCGIAGIIDYSQTGDVHSAIDGMVNALKHRGPDGNGKWIDKHVGLGHTRLSIIDLAGGSQPMSSSDGNLQIVFNGEIYNYRALRETLQSHGHRFMTNSDTEVVLAAYKQWGEKCCLEFEGMFAFGIVDLQDRSLFLARDQFGIKPLVYALQQGLFVFASELNAIRRALPKPPIGSLESIDKYLQLQYIPAPHTIYKDVYKLGPGQFLFVPLDELPPFESLMPGTYWHLSNTATQDADVNHAEAMVHQAVRSSLVSDVPFGVFLSGGVDSTLIAWQMSELLEQPVEAFSISFDDESYDESAYAKQAADTLGIKLHQQTVSFDVEQLLPTIVRQYGEPFGDSSALPTWHVSQLARSHVPMVLGGDGADELFAGYSSFQHFMSMGAFSSALRLMRKPSRRTLSRFLWDLTYLVGDPIDRRITHWTRCMGFIPRDMRQALYHDQAISAYLDSSSIFADYFYECESADDLTAAQWVNIKTYLPNDILTKVDIASMAHGLEVRPPLLSVKLAEYALRLPVRERIENQMIEGRTRRVGKVPLKRMLASRFDEAFVHRTKQGFAIPRDRWFAEQTPLRQDLQEMIHTKDSALNNTLCQSAMQRTLDRHSLTFDLSGHLWLLLVLGTWLEQNREVQFA